MTYGEIRNRDDAETTPDRRLQHLVPHDRRFRLEFQQFRRNSWLQPSLPQTAREAIVSPHRTHKQSRSRSAKATWKGGDEAMNSVMKRLVATRICRSPRLLGVCMAAVALRAGQRDQVCRQQYGDHHLRHPEAGGVPEAAAQAWRFGEDGGRRHGRAGAQGAGTGTRKVNIAEGHGRCVVRQVRRVEQDVAQAAFGHARPGRRDGRRISRNSSASRWAGASCCRRATAPKAA